MPPNSDSEFHRKFRLVLAKIRYSYTSGGEPIIFCNQHGSTSVLVVLRQGFQFPDKVCTKCFFEQFPEIRSAGPKGTRVFDAVFDCFVDGCPNKVDYHSTCIFCGKPVCAAHSDQSYCCFACLQDEENQCGTVKRSTSERGS